MLRFRDTGIPAEALRWKDAGGARLCRGDKVIIHDVGQDFYGVIEFYPDFCTHAVRITHRLQHIGSRGWTAEGGVVTVRRALDGMKRYPLSSRLKDVTLVERAAKPAVICGNPSGYAPKPLL